MNPWFAKAVILAGAIAIVLIPASVHRGRGEAKIVRSQNGQRERILLALVSVGFLVPFLWATTTLLSFADYPLRPVTFAVGICCIAAGLWLLYRSHDDLGANWSMSLEVRENHQLVAHGVYRSVRHPMYAALLLYALGQAFVVPNGLAGPSYLVALALLFSFRIIPEERMMEEEFGPAYQAYKQRTRRLVPRVW